MNFDEVIDRTSSNSSRWQEFGAGVLAMTTGDMDFSMPPPVRAAIDARADHGVIGYDSVPAAVTQAVMARLDRLYGWQVDPDWFVYIPGVVPGLNQACRAFVDAGAAVLSEAPVYYPFLDAPGNNAQVLRTVPVSSAAGHVTFDFDAIESVASQADTQMLMLCNPQNPTGRVATRPELEQLAEICLRHDVLICSDEIHAEVVFDDHQHIPIANLSPEVSAKTVTLMSPSKAFGISGLGGAFAIISDPALRERFETAGKGIIANINVFAVVAMQAAYSECDEWLAGLMAYLTDNRRAALETLGQLPGVQITAPQATYFMWLDVTGTGLNDPHAAILESGVALTEGERFAGPGHLRLNFATPRSRLDEVMRRISTRLA